MDPTYDFRLVGLSVVVAICAAYTALSLASRLNLQNTTKALWVWATGGAVSMGFGIWSMHFIGMLAMSLPIPLAYDPTWTLFSLGCAIGLSGLALHTIHVQTLTFRRLALGAVGMATGICVMHYVGMGALHITPGITYDPLLFSASVAIALAASFVAILLIRRLRHQRGMSAFVNRLAAAGLMGLAISGMHYTGMAAAHFSADAVCTTPTDGASPIWLSATIALGTIAIMTIAVLSSIFDAHLKSSTGELNHSLSEANQKLARMAMQDSLTGLPNRSLFSDRLEHAIGEAAASSESMAIMLINLDRFKAVNETLGHRAGDRLLTQVARRFETCLRPADTLARLGGDEFVVLLRGLTRPTTASELASRMAATVTDGVIVGDRPVHVAMSIGIAMYPTDGADAETLMVNAGAAMAHAKQRALGGFQFFAPGMNDFAQKRFEIENDLRRAIPAGELALFYQPKISRRDGRVVALEALVRWKHPVRGLLAPGEFITIAEETGLIEAIGGWVLHEACRQNMAWQRQGLAPLPVAVNLSARQFQQCDLFDRIRSVLADTGMPAERLELELTESAVMRDTDRSVRILKSLDALGVRIAIDDFGTGYSSLGQLKRLPLHVLKIDRSFIRDVASNPDDEAIVRAVISMAHSLRLEVIAEGVETGAQLAVLKALGCDQFQGYYFSPPVPPEAIEKLLDAGADIDAGLHRAMAVTD